MKSELGTFIEELKNEYPDFRVKIGFEYDDLILYFSPDCDSGWYRHRLHLDDEITFEERLVKTIEIALGQLENYEYNE